MDLHQTAHAHLHSCLLKVKSIAASTDLPDELRTGIAKPDLEPEEKAALHNVTSGLYNRECVKQAVDKAVTSICDHLNLPTPDKAKRSRKQNDKESEIPAAKKQKVQEEEDEEEAADDDESEFEGFESDVDEPGPTVGELNSEEEAEEEAKFSKYDHLLGGSSEEEDSDDQEDEDDLIAKLKSRSKIRETVNLDDISDAEDSGAETDLGSLSDVSSEAVSPPPEKPKKLKAEKAREKPREPKPAKSGKEEMFLPSLMGGYISGSESASDIDVAPPKKRLGQRQRQAIAEKKYGDKAKHFQKQAKSGGRDGGWDARRGAVNGDDKGKKPWKKGIQGPSNKQGHVEQREVKPAKRDDSGPLHPSWEARKKAKDSQKAVAFEGAKITFD